MKVKIGPNTFEEITDRDKASGFPTWRLASEAAREYTEVMDREKPHRWQGFLMPKRRGSYLLVVCRVNSSGHKVRSYIKVTN